jgi:hypothetical protein
MSDPFEPIFKPCLVDPSMFFASVDSCFNVEPSFWITERTVMVLSNYQLTTF